MDVVGVMVAYLPVVRVCTAQSREALYNNYDCLYGTEQKLLLPTNHTVYQPG